MRYIHDMIRMVGLIALAAVASGETMRENARQLPVVQNVDVVVVGGTSAAVAAAVRSKTENASVFLVSPRPYLGEDLAGKLLAYDASWIETDLERKIFGDPKAAKNTMLHVKKSLDHALVSAKIPFLTGALVTEVLIDDAGKPAGVVISDRSGRHAVKAKCIIDATERAHVARLAGAEFTPFPAGNYTFTRMVISADTPRADGMRVKEHIGLYPARVQMGGWKKNDKNVVTGRLFSCEISLPMKDGSARSFAEAEQKARDLTFTRQQLVGADTMLFVPPDRLISQAFRSDVSPAISGFLPRGIDNVLVLSLLAHSDEAERQRQTNPRVALVTGDRIGAQAAQLARRRPAVGNVRVAGSATASDRSARILEADGDLPPYLKNAQDSVESSGRDLPVIASCDIFVAGAGTGGAPAGIAANRHGMKTIICDYLYSMGGVQTDGLIGWYCFGNRVGFTKEIDKGEKETGLLPEQSRVEWYCRQNRANGGEVWYGTLVTGVLVENNAVTGVVVVMPDGERGVVRCKVAIDATGNAVLPALAGEETEFITADEVSVQGAGMTPRTLGARYTNTDIGFVDDTDAADLCYFALRSRASMPDDVWDQAQVVNTRERRRLIGAFYVSPMDIMNHRTYPDTISQPFSNFDTHGQTIHPLFFIADPGHKGISLNLPYRAFLPKRVDGLLVIGLGMSAHRDAMPVIRMQPDVQNQGYAAGTAAALAIRSGVSVRNVNIKTVQRELVDLGILSKDVLTMKDSFPLPDSAIVRAVREMTDNYKGFNVVLTDPVRSIPLLRKAYGRATEATNRLVYAHVLAMMGEKDGEDDLIAKVKENPWDPGWNFRGMGQFNRSVSMMDSYIIALGRCRSAKAVPAILEKVKALGGDNRYSHFRSVCLALESIGDKSAAPVLAQLLAKPKVGGHSLGMDGMPPAVPRYANEAGDKERTLCLRELCLARTLYRLGDWEGKGKATLTAYAADPRRVYANHCRQVLAGGKKD